MKKCAYCGAEYPDDAVVCAVDRTPLEHGVGARKIDRTSIFTPRARKVLGFLFLLFASFVSFLWSLDLNRSRDFRRKIREGRPLVRAIEQFRTDTGNYPQALSDLLPKYLTGIATNAAGLRKKFGGWDYFLNTNDGEVSYIVGNWNLGHASIEYTPSNWTGNVDGSFRIVRKGL